MFKLKESGSGWKFYSEAELERFIWIQLNNLFGLYPLKQQYFINGQFCDILALNNRNQLVIIELKNEEDRYVVQQLTRYYHTLFEEKPFQDKVDYSEPVCLVAICPSFHRDNLIDKQYSRLEIELFSFEILASEFKFSFYLKDLNGNQSWNINIPYQPNDGSLVFPQVPRKLSNYLESLDEEECERILSIRERILKFDERMKEITLGSGFIYGKGKSHPCAEFRFKSSYPLINLFLWLPHFSRNRICRMLVRTRDWVLVNELTYYPEGFRQAEFASSVWREPTLMVKVLQEWEHMKDSYAAKKYVKLLENPDKANLLDLLVEVAFDCWVERL